LVSQDFDAGTADSHCAHNTRLKQVRQRTERDGCAPDLDSHVTKIRAFCREGEPLRQAQDNAPGEPILLINTRLGGRGCLKTPLESLTILLSFTQNSSWMAQGLPWVLQPGGALEKRERHWLHPDGAEGTACRAPMPGTLRGSASGASPSRAFALTPGEMR
jgi:hypothetical protein